MARDSSPWLFKHIVQSQIAAGGLRARIQTIRKQLGKTTILGHHYQQKVSNSPILR